ncbi:MAG TPA: bifunctional methylenetetrahydrofolate dehydrogenase/methenyltetrahydrofolate cyclohydrolase FolD [Anaerolineae bacterium]|nr:bifunctional methylenetetrahydrofolate dehydrogenase/methenyltetrahydrofolate cyclohydrolase FolD [Anaerolineae bacterium]
MTAQIIDGKAIADKIRRQVAREAAQFRDKTGVQPGLATVLVGDNSASATYVRSKQKACEELGMRSVGHHLPADATQEEVEGLVRSLGADPAVHGILVQLPLPGQINEEAVLNAVPIDKDVDGFHPVNIGRLAMKGRKPVFVPCTPAGCIVLLDEAGVPIKGANAVVVGRSNIVGMPAALLLVHRDATVTIVHSRTHDLPGVVRQADILIVAIGKAHFVTGDMIKPGAAVIDVGINSIPDPTKKSGQRLVGDVDFESVKEVAGCITPVPGGVGPMTIAMLMRNTLEAAKHAVEVGVRVGS